MTEAPASPPPARDRPVRLGQSVVIGGAGFTLVDRLACLYLAAPVALFWPLWFRPVLAAPLAIASLAALPALLGPGLNAPPPLKSVIVAAGVALAWTLLGGAGHVFYANAFDWITHDAVLRDLVTRPAPVAYLAHGGDTVIMRAPIAYYMVPAVVGRLIGLSFADAVLLAWTTLGVGLFLSQVLAGERRWRSAALVCAVVVLSAGLDILGRPASLFDLAHDRGWWANYYQYTSMTGLLYWAPHHALPGWLSMAMIYRGRDDRRFVGLAAWLGAVTLMWSPLASIGLLPFFAELAWRRLRRREVRWLLTPANLLAAPVLVAASALYLTPGAGGLGSLVPAPPDFAAGALVYAVFVALEFGVMALALLWFCRGGVDPPTFAVAIATLLLLPLLRFGPSNDIVMRSSIPALAVLVFCLADGWARPADLRSRGVVIPILIAVGSVMPLTEIARALAWTRWPPDLQRTLYDINQGLEDNYLLRLTPDMPLARLLAKPVSLPTCPPATAAQRLTAVVEPPAPGGRNALTLANPQDREVMVKLRTFRRQRIVTAFLRPRASLVVSGLPDGRFIVEYARGGDYSAACRMFVTGLTAARLEAPLRLPGDAGVRLPTVGAEEARRAQGLSLPEFLFD